MKRAVTRWIGTFAWALCCIAVGGCNTVSGFGQDMRDAGAAIKKAAE